MSDQTQRLYQQIKKLALDSSVRKMPPLKEVSSEYERLKAEQVSNHTSLDLLKPEFKALNRINNKLR